MTPEDRASAIFAEPGLEESLQQLAPLIRNRDLSRTSKVIFILKLADQVAAKVAPHAICSTGCSHCCRMAVPLADIEAKMIGAAIGRERRSVARHVKYSPVGREQREQVAKWKGVPCTFLGDAGECTIYQHRPLACRTHFSLESTADPCDIVKNPGQSVATPDLSPFAMACAAILAGTPYADIREFFPKEE